MLLHPVNNDFSHYVGIATFLRGIPFLEPKALVRPDKRHASEPPLVADFEPWIERATVFPRSHLPYVCPMHPQQGVMHPGRCPICGMPLEPNKAPRPWGVLHDPVYTMGFQMLLLAPQQNAPTSSLSAIQAAACERHLLFRSPIHARAPITQPQPKQLVRLVFTPNIAEGFSRTFLRSMRKKYISSG